MILYSKIHPILSWQLQAQDSFKQLNGCEEATSTPKVSTYSTTLQCAWLPSGNHW